MRNGLTAVLVTMSLALVALAPAAAEPNQADYGITLAMSGALARAESVFVSQLGPGDARALNNLGNLQLLRGRPDVALAFYEQAVSSDTADAGIQLNRTVALMLLGREDEARDQAATAMARAGGERPALALLGLKADTTKTSRGAEKAYISSDEVRALLAAAARGVPRDTSRAVPPAVRPGGKRPAALASVRPGGMRAADASEAGAILYWKR
jgi:tetratricopeptide (TPR) repeat protein